MLIGKTEDTAALRRRPLTSPSNIRDEDAAAIHRRQPSGGDTVRSRQVAMLVDRGSWHRDRGLRGDPHIADYATEPLF